MPHLKTDRRPAATQTRYVAEYTVISIKEITKDDRKLTRPRLETAQFEDAAIRSELHSRGRSPQRPPAASWRRKCRTVAVRVYSPASGHVRCKEISLISRTHPIMPPWKDLTMLTNLSGHPIFFRILQ